MKRKLFTQLAKIKVHFYKIGIKWKNSCLIPRSKIYLQTLQLVETLKLKVTTIPGAKSVLWIFEKPSYILLPSTKDQN